MMYSEFLKATNARDNEPNERLFQILHSAYMNSDATKEEIYEIGRRCKNNALSTYQIEWNKEVLEAINGYKADIKMYAENAEKYQAWADEATDDDDREFWTRQARYEREHIQTAKNAINMRKGLLYK